MARCGWARRPVLILSIDASPNRARFRERCGKAGGLRVLRDLWLRHIFRDTSWRVSLSSAPIRRAIDPVFLRSLCTDRVGGYWTRRTNSLASTPLPKLPLGNSQWRIGAFPAHESVRVAGGFDNLWFRLEALFERAEFLATKRRVPGDPSISDGGSRRASYESLGAARGTCRAAPMTSERVSVADFALGFMADCSKRSRWIKGPVANLAGDHVLT